MQRIMHNTREDSYVVNRVPCMLAFSIPTAISPQLEFDVHMINSTLRVAFWFTIRFSRVGFFW